MSKIPSDHIPDTIQSNYPNNVKRKHQSIKRLRFFFSNSDAILIDHKQNLEFDRQTRKKKTNQKRNKFDLGIIEIKQNNKM